MSVNFVHLHNHTEYSLLDGALRVDQLLKTAHEFDMPAVAITDHGVLYGMIEFYQKARNYNIKPIIGCEVYLTPGFLKDKNTRERYHLVLLAVNKKGYHNLIKIVSRGWLEGYYYKPRVDKDLLYKYRKGLIALSSCLQGEIEQLILNGNQDQLDDVISDYRAIFGRDNFFLELQDHNLADEKKVNSRLIKVGKKYDIPLVVSNDVHYLNKEDADLHDILLALQTGKTVNDEDRMTFPNDQFYFKSPREMRSLFPELGEAYQNTVRIADRIKVEIDFDKFYLPSYPDCEKEQDPAELLREKCEKGLSKRGLDGKDEARKRLDYELGIIEEMGYVSYFLIVHDFVAYAEENGIRVGPGRGSAAGSLVSYLLGITKINPLKYGLIFERFLNPERVTMPDIDIDFDEQRDQIIEYVINRYGEERVAQIGTFGTMAARAAVRDVGRALDIPYGKVDKIAKMIPASHGITLDKALDENPDLSERYEGDQETQELIDFARGVEGLPRHISTHAAGVIIGPEPLTEIIPLQFQDESTITQLPMDQLEDMGLLKMDFLGLRNLTVIGKAVDLIEDKYNKQIDIENVPLSDPEVYRMLQEGNTLGVFQMESYLFQDLNRRLKPEKFEDIIALLALGRPGPLGSNLVDDYIKSRHGEKEPEYLHPKLKPILKETFGLILYQEQVMQIAGDLAGYSMGEADLLRRGMGKKKKKLVARERQRFVDGAMERGISEEIAHKIFDQMEYFAGYGFNKSHSAAYAMLAYQTAYLKAKYPPEFMAALLSTVMNNLDKVGKYIQAAREMDIEVLPPDINESGYEFMTTDSGNIRFGLKAIKNVGKNAIKSIISGREDKQYVSLQDFLKRVDLKHINITTLESLIKSGAMDSFGIYRSQLLIKFEELYKRYSTGQRNHNRGQRSFFDIVNNSEEFYDDRVEYPDINKLSFQERLSLEREYLGIYISGHPLDPYQKKIEGMVSINCEQLQNRGEGKKAIIAGILVDKKEHITKNNKQMAFITVEDQKASIDVIVFPDLYNKLTIPLERGEGLLIYGHLSDDSSFIAHNILPLDSEYLIINMSSFCYEKLDELYRVLTSNSGNIPVIFKIGGKVVICDNKYRVKKHSVFNKQLKKLLGESNYIYI